VGGTVKRLHSFNPNQGEGGNPSAGMVLVDSETLYGTTSGGSSGAGSLFTWDTNQFCDNPPAGDNSGGLGVAWFLVCVIGGLGGNTHFETIHSFSTQNDCSEDTCLDGAQPKGGLILASDGSLYGTTAQGGGSSAPESGTQPPSPCLLGAQLGSPGCGTIFKTTTGGTFTSFYSFCDNCFCPDGYAPSAALLQATDGNFYGTTRFGGGATQNCIDSVTIPSGSSPAGCGTIFKITPQGVLTTLYSFRGLADGSQPQAALLQSTDGNFYGTTPLGGTFGMGTIFQITPAGKLTTLYNFTGGSDGASPLAALLQGADGIFYGTTSSGGAAKDGTVFSLSMGYAISGQVTDNTGSPEWGVAMTLSGSASQSATTNNGNYNFFLLPPGGNYTVTPSGNGCSFSPPGATFNSLSGSQTANFVCTPVGAEYTISGQVTGIAGTGLNGVSVTLSGAPGGVTVVTTDSAGNYSFQAPPGGNYTVTAFLAGYTFAPPNQAFNSLSGNQTANFMSATYTVSGQVTFGASGLSGVAMALSGSQSSSVLTDGSGNYTFAAPAGGSYTVTPSLSGYSFNPASQSVDILSGNQTIAFEGSLAISGATSVQFNAALQCTNLPGSNGVGALDRVNSYARVKLRQYGQYTSPLSQRLSLNYSANPDSVIGLNYGFSSLNLGLQYSLGDAARPRTSAAASDMSNVGSVPQLASGGNQWTTTFTLLNNGTAAANVGLNFFDDNGNPLPLPLTFPQGSPNQTTAAFTGSLNAGAALVSWPRRAGGVAYYSV